MVSTYLSILNNPRTLETYGRYVCRFVDWVGADHLAELDTEDLLNYITYLQETYAPASINLQLAAVRDFLRWAATTRRVPESVYAAARLVKSVKQPKRLPRPLNQDEVERVLSLPNLSTFYGARDYALLSFMLATGARLAEVLALNVQDLQFDSGGGFVIVNGKGDKERQAFFDVDTAGALIAYLNLCSAPKTGPLFVSDEGERLSGRRVQRMFAEYGARASVVLHPHKLRRTFAVDALNASGDVHTVSKLLGHSDIRTTEIYVELADANLRRVAAAGASRRRRQPPEEREAAYVHASRERQPVSIRHQ